MVGRLRALPLWAKALLVLAVLILFGLLGQSGVLSALASLGAFLMLIIAILVLVYRVLRRRPLRNWSLIAVAAFGLMIVYAGIAGARLGEAPKQASSPSNSQEEEQEASTEEAKQEASVEEPIIEEAEEVADLEETEPTPDDENGDSGRFDAVATVTRVVDGDTVEISPAIDGIEDVRFIGVDTPEVSDPNCEGEQPYGREASEFTQDQLEGQKIELEFDKDKTDKYDRLLAYVYPKGEEMFNKELLEEGYAQVRTFRPNTKYEPQFKESEREAKQAKRGIWSLSRLDVIKLMDKADAPGGDGCSLWATPKAQPQPQPQPQPQFDVPPPAGGGGGKTCSDFSTRSEAMQALPANPQLDRNKDGVPCESLPP